MPSMDDILKSAKGLTLDRSVGALQTAFKEITALTDKYNVFESRNEELGKSFNLTVAQAARLGDALDKNADRLKIGGEALRSLTQNLKGLIGPLATTTDLFNAGFGEQLITTSKALIANFKLSGDAANKLIRATHRAGKNLDIEIAKRIQITDLIEAQMGGVELTTDALTDVANLTSDLQMQYGRIPGQLELSVIKAKQLGISMATLNSAGQNLLNIESSIGQEMEYQLLTGRRLVDQDGESLTNKYRIATIQGKSSDQADILYQMLEKEGKTLRENLFARQKFAELNGMDEGTLSTMLQKYEAIQDLPGAKNLFKLSGDELMTKVATLTTDATTLAALSEANDQRSTTDVLKDIEDQLVTGGIRAILDTQDTSAEAIATAQRNLRLDAARGASGLVGGAANAANLVSLPGLVATIGTDLAAVPGIVADAFLNVIGGGKTISKTNPLPVAVVADGGTDDFASFGGTGRMLLGPAGAMSINDNDLVVGGTNLFGGSNGSNSQAVAQMAAGIVNAINNQTRELKADPIFGRGLTNSYYG